MARSGFAADHFRAYGTDTGVWKHTLFSHELQYLRFLRKRQRVSGGFLRRWYALRQIRFDRKYGLTILTDRIGDGLYLGHGHGINVEEDCVIGKNCNLSKNCTLGRVMRGEKKGSPVLGDNVWIGTGAMVLGRITIGDDVLIAPNACVTEDVPAHSVVSGNPCVIRHRENATEGYINHTV